MTNMTNKQYEQLRQVIIKAVPNIVKLDFGCKVIHHNFKREELIIGIEYPLMLKKVKNNDEPYYRLTGFNGLFAKHQFKIIGRDIRLADVLIAFPVEKEIGYKKIDLNVSNNGETLFIDTKNKSCSWNLKNNSLDWHWRNQKETIDFLFNLLV